MSFQRKNAKIIVLQLPLTRLRNHVMSLNTDSNKAYVNYLKHANFSTFIKKYFLSFLSVFETVNTFFWPKTRTHQHCGGRVVLKKRFDFFTFLSVNYFFSVLWKSFVRVFFKFRNTCMIDYQLFLGLYITAFMMENTLV